MYKCYVYVYIAPKIDNINSNPASIATTTNVIALSPNKRINAVATDNPKILNAFAPESVIALLTVSIKSKDMFSPPSDLVSIHLPQSLE